MANTHHAADDFWIWFKRRALKAGRRLAQSGVELKLSIESEETPVWAKAIGLGALAYLVNPFDPLGLDPLVFHDDLAVLIGAISSIGRYVTPLMKKEARTIVDDAFGPEDPDQNR